MRALPLAFLSLLVTPFALGGATDPAGDGTSGQGWDDILAADFALDGTGSLVLEITLQDYATHNGIACWNADFILDGAGYQAILFDNGSAVTVSYRADGSGDTYHASVATTFGEPATLRATLGTHVVPAHDGSVASWRLVRACAFVVTVRLDSVDNGAPTTLHGADPIRINAPSRHEGEFALGGALGMAADSCTEPETEGLTSACLALAPSELGNTYALTATDDTGDALETMVCFYDGDRTLLECGGVTLVPDEARYVGLSAATVLPTRWTFETFVPG